MNSPLRLERRDAVAIVAIHNAPYNRMTLDFIDRLEEVVADIAGDTAIRAAVLTAEGLENFSVGMDLKQLSEGIQHHGSPEAFLDQRLRVIAAIENMGKPWITRRAWRPSLKKENRFLTGPTEGANPFRGQMMSNRHRRALIAVGPVAPGFTGEPQRIKP